MKSRQERLRKTNMSLIHLHPQLVHFPIALIISAGMFDALSMVFKKESLHQAARGMFNLAALFAIASSITGWVEADRLNLHHPLLTSHRLDALLLTGLLSFSCLALIFIPQKMKRPFFSVILALAVILVVLTGHHGGQMVYGYGVGVHPS